MITCQTRATVRSRLDPAWSALLHWTWARTSVVFDTGKWSATATLLVMEVTDWNVGPQLIRTSTVSGEHNSKEFNELFENIGGLLHLTLCCYQSHKYSLYQLVLIGAGLARHVRQHGHAVLPEFRGVKSGAGRSCLLGCCRLRTRQLDILL